MLAFAAHHLVIFQPPQQRVRLKLIAVFHLGEKVLLALSQFRRNVCSSLFRHRGADQVALYSGSRMTGVSGRQQTPRFHVEQYNLKEGIRSCCAVPLVARGGSLGVLIILSSQMNQYSKDHADFLQEVSNQAVLAVKSLMPSFAKRLRTRLICPRCIASGGGRTTAAKY